MTQSFSHDSLLSLSRKAPPDLVAWVQKQLARKSSLIVLRQRTDGGEVLVSRWNLGGESAERIALEIDDCTYSEGHHLRGPILFYLYAYHPSEREHVERKTYRIEGETFSRKGETEEANMAGVTSQLMRHTEGATKVALGHTSTIIGHYQQLLEKSYRRIEELEERRLDVAALHEALLSQEHERKLALIRVEQSGKRSEMIGEQLKLLLPVVTNKFLAHVSHASAAPSPPAASGAPRPAPASPVADEILRSFLESITDEQASQIFSVLTPAQAQALWELNTRVAKRSQDPAVAAAAHSGPPPVPPASPPPEAQDTGGPSPSSRN